MPAACPSCGNEAVACLGPIAPGYQFAGRVLAAPLPGGDLYASPACFLYFRWPQPPKAALDALYRQAPPEHWQYTPADRRDWQITRRWLQAHRSAGKVLDVGCYDGAFLDALGPSWDRYGIELNEAAARKAAARGVQIVAHDLEALANAPLSFDAVVAFNVIEHVADCRGLLARMAERLRPGGVAVLGSGNTQAPSWRLMGSRYWYCTIPEHLAFIGVTWAEAAAQTLGLRLLHLERFSLDAHRTPLRIGYECAVNLLYRFLPGVFGTLRSLGVGEVDARQHPALKHYPPMWTTARDHVVAIFEKL